MAPMRARFLSLLLITVHGAHGGIGQLEHGLLGRGVVVPTVQGRQVSRRQFPLAYGVDLADQEAGALLGARDREPQLDHGDAFVGEHALELGRLAHEPSVLLVGAIAHDPFDAGPVVPGPVEQHDLPGRGQVLDVPLEVPLALLALARLLERDDGRTRAGSGAP